MTYLAEITGHEALHHCLESGVVETGRLRKKTSHPSWLSHEAASTHAHAHPHPSWLGHESAPASRESGLLGHEARSTSTWEAGHLGCDARAAREGGLHRTLTELALVRWRRCVEERVVTACTSALHSGGLGSLLLLTEPSLHGLLLGRLLHGETGGLRGKERGSTAQTTLTWTAGAGLKTRSAAESRGGVGVLLLLLPV
jgi:hypothetical protein